MTKEESIAFLNSLIKEIEATPPEALREKVKKLGLEHCFKNVPTVRCPYCGNEIDENKSLDFTSAADAERHGLIDHRIAAQPQRG